MDQDEAGIGSSSGGEGPGDEARAVFGPRLPLAQAFAEFLVGPGIDRGLLGPRERDSVWSRHLVNCAVVAELLPPGTRIVDVGSGAGLPGLALACVRPDLQVDLIEPMARRVDFLTEAIELLDCADRVRVWRGRGEETAIRREIGPVEFVTARAVAPLDRLSSVCLPLLSRGGSLLAIKGARAAEEVAEHRAAIRSLGGDFVRVVACGVDVIAQPTIVVQIDRAQADRLSSRRAAIQHPGHSATSKGKQ